jgi:hypothetical protein
MTHSRGARPIQSKEVLQWLGKFSLTKTDYDKYEYTWRNWLQNSEHKTLTGLENFLYSDYTHGTSQTFDHFLLKHNSRNIIIFPGEFQYHQCTGRYLTFSNIITENSALIISIPFSDSGKAHPELLNTLHKCNQLGVPVCIDLAYWGISKNIELDLDKFPCITEITSSLSKPFFTLEQHRVGVRFCRDYANDGISMINEVGMSNTYSMSLGVHYMEKFNCDHMWKTYNDAYYKICNNLNLHPTDTVIFGLGGDEYKKYNRGVPGNNRVCISDSMRDL